MSPIEELKKFGFQCYGVWKEIEKTTKSFSHNIDSALILDKEIFLYAFILKDDIVYIGKSDRSVKKRLAGWANTKESLKKKIKARIEFNKAVRSKDKLQIYLCFPDISINENAVNISNAIQLDNEAIKNLIRRGINQGLESKLIRYFQKKHSQCIWNYKIKEKTKKK